MCCLLLTVELFFFWQICERSLTSSTGGPAGPPATCFVRAEMLPSGYLIRPCEGGGSIIHIVDHIDFDVRTHPPMVGGLSSSFCYVFVGLSSSWSPVT